MKKLLPALLMLIAPAAVALAAPGPIRVLYLATAGTPAAKHCAVLMRELGRDAIWFDYTADSAAVTPEWLAKFDAVLLAAPKDAFEGLGTIDAQRVVKAELEGDERSWARADFLEALRARLLAAAGEARHKEWQAFLAKREPEKREPGPHIANYEKRPEPITFQHPFSVPGSMERTQVSPDLRLALFASEPDISKPIALAWDERGRLWVAETQDYPHGVNPTGPGHDRIKICEDTNGDGRADKFTVFADELNIPTSWSSPAAASSWRNRPASSCSKIATAMTGPIRGR